MSNWTISSAIEKLDASKNTFYPNVTPQVVPILRRWADQWDSDPEWRSLLNKKSLHKELEESIVAIDQLITGTSKQQIDKEAIIVMDLCAGKGLFSFLLSYLAPSHVTEIIMLENAAINWHHIIHGANPTAKKEGRPYIHIWDKTNLHDYDSVLDRMKALPAKLALTGIHLCKQLGPSFCGLVNGLGEQCIYACLAPCCVPRAVTTQKNHQADDKKDFILSVQLLECPEERRTRLDYMKRRQRVRRKPREGPCFYCQHPEHGLIDCPNLPKLPIMQQTKIRREFHTATIPCWNCLNFGHFKQECPVSVKRANPLAIQAPLMQLDVSQILEAKRPFDTYCSLLAGGFQDRKCNVIQTDLENSEKHQDSNWNGERKSIFLVVGPREKVMDQARGARDDNGSSSRLVDNKSDELFCQAIPSEQANFLCRYYP